MVDGCCGCYGALVPISGLGSGTIVTCHMSRVGNDRAVYSKERFMTFVAVTKRALPLQVLSFLCGIGVLVAMRKANEYTTV